MIVNIVIEHRIKHGHESETIQLIKELHHRHNASQDDDDGLIADCYRHHLPGFGQLSPLSNTPPKVRVYMTS